MWSPRERHTVVVFPREPPVSQRCGAGGHESRIYVFGGFSTRYVHKCGTHGCGEDYRVFMNDVWRSKKNCTELQRKSDPAGCAARFKCQGDLPCFGEEWELITQHAPWRGRGSHGTVVKNSHIFLFGGRGGDTRVADTNMLFSDVWKSGDEGRTWELVTEDAGWAPRDGFAFGALEPCEVSDLFSLLLFLYLCVSVDSRGCVNKSWLSRPPLILSSTCRTRAGGGGGGHTTN